jgi:hypothetical protein
MIPSPGRTHSQPSSARKPIADAMPLLTLQIYGFYSIQTCRSCGMEFLGLVVDDVELCRFKIPPPRGVPLI